jgi:undecaprenyl-diphosphatase
MRRNVSFQNVAPYFLIVLFYLVALAFLVTFYGYKESFLILNGNAFSWLDWPMFVLTHLGDSMIIASILSMTLVKKHPGPVIAMIIIVIITGLIGQALKITIFEDWDRPLRVFNESKEVHTLTHYRLFHNSFPSGHSITAVAAFSTIVLFLNPRKSFQIILGILTILITYSRIYLGVHFPGDVLAGSLFGLTLSIGLTLLMFNKFSSLTVNNKVTNFILILSIALLVIGTFTLRVFFPLI